MPRKSRMRPGGAPPPLGPCQSVGEIEAAIHICLTRIWYGEDVEGRAHLTGMHLKTLLWSKFTTKGLEIKGLNMDGSAPEVKVTLTDYAAEHDQLQALKEENEALREQNAVLMQGRERPRPPRPQMN